MLDLVLFVVIAWLIVYLVIGTIAAILVAREWRRIGCRRRQWRDRNGRREGGGRSHARHTDTSFEKRTDSLLFTLANRATRGGRS